LAVGLLKRLAALPYHWQLALGRGCGRLFGRLAPYRRRIARINLTRCFPERSPTQIEQLLSDHWAALGIGLFETALAWWGSDPQIRRLGQVSGVEHLDQALAQGRGVILLTGHFIPLELGARFITLHRPFHALYRPHKNPLFETLMRHERERRSRLPPLTRDDMRGLLRGLRRGQAVWYAPDQNLGPKYSVVAPFFGIPTLTVSATARLARISGAPVVPYFPQRLPGRAGDRVTIFPALAQFPSGDDTADARRINQLIEGWIRQAPEQYLWVHRRFKKGPPGYDNFYQPSGRPAR
jgi:KDO2-lipid IV(A) lauroyltransferase